MTIVHHLQSFLRQYKLLNQLHMLQELLTRHYQDFSALKVLLVFLLSQDFLPGEAGAFGAFGGRSGSDSDAVPHGGHD